MTKIDKKATGIGELEEKIIVLERRLKKTKGKVLGEDVVLFYGHLLAESEHAHLEGFVRTYYHTDFKKNPHFFEISPRAGIGSLRLMYMRCDQYGPSLTLDIGDEHIIAMMVHRGRLGLGYSEEMPELSEKFPYLKELVIVNMH
jgi:hypothetical protein